MRLRNVLMLGALLVAGCNEGEEGEVKGAQPVPKTTPALLEFSAPEAPKPPLPPPAPVAYEVQKPLPAPPPPAPPPPTVLSAPVFDDPGPALAEPLGFVRKAWKRRQ